jgi:hypothetical protein
VSAWGVFPYKIPNSYETKVKNMKIRSVAVLLILSLAAWLPTVAQQSSAPQPAAPTADSAKPSDKTACSCCQHSEGNTPASKSAMSCCHDKDAKAAQSSSCCEANDGKQMACCKKDAQGKSAECCAGKDAQMCAKNAKNGDKPCCDQTTCKSCCEKASASNTAAASSKTCCAAANHNCCHAKSQA